MSTDADAHKVGLIPVTLMVSGNIMGSGVFLLPGNLASTGGIAIYGWLVTIIGALALSMVYAKMSSLVSSPGGSYAYARRCFGPFLGYQTNVLYWLACWIGNIAMVVIGVGYLSYFFPILKDPLVLTLTCVVVLWVFVLLNIVGPKMITRVQAVATVLALVPIVGIAVFGWFWFRGETYMAAVTAGSKVTQFLCCPFDAMGSTMATYCGQNVGAGRVDRIESGVKKCSMLGIAYAIIALIVIIPFGGEFSKLFIDGTQTEILDLAKQFLWLNVLFYIPLAFVNIIRFSIQGLGNSQLAVFAGVFEMIARGGVALGLVPAFGYVAVCLASPAAWVLADLFLFPAFFHSVKILKNRFPSSSATAEKNDTES